MPGTNRPLTLKAETLVEHVPQRGWLLDPSGQLVARLDDFRFDFLHFDHALESERAARAGRPRTLTPCPQLRSLDLAGSRFTTFGDWFWIDGWLFGHHGNAAARLTFESDSPRVVLKFHAHGWSGIAQLQIDDEEPQEIDLYHQEVGVPRSIELVNASRVPRRIALSPTGRRNPNSQGSEMIVEEILEEAGPPGLPSWRRKKAGNRGGPFPVRAIAMLDDVPQGGLLLDIGGGRRQIEDERYLNLEYAPFSEPDLLGDALALPFRDGVIDAVYSSAVLEHVRDPWRFAEEVWRVLKPGGRILVNAAFMQPVHSEGQHFFNHTPYAMDMLFSRFVGRQLWWSGSLKDNVAWMLSLAKIEGQIDATELSAFKGTLAKLSDLVSYERLMYFASDVWLEARKPA